MTYRAESVEAINAQQYKINGLYRSPGTSAYGAVGEAEESLAEEMMGVLSAENIVTLNAVKKIGHGAGGGKGNGGGTGYGGGAPVDQPRDVPILEAPSEDLRMKLDLDSFQLTMNGLIEKLIASLKLETDEIVAKQTEDRVEVEKKALEASSKRMTAKIQNNIQAMQKAAKNKKIMKVLTWVMVGLAVVMAVVGAAVLIAGAIAAGVAAGIAGASAAGTASVTAAGVGGAAAAGATIGTTSVVSGVVVTTTANGFSLSLATTSTAVAATTTTATTTTATTAAAATTTAAAATTGAGTGTAAVTEAAAVKASEVIAKAMAKVVTKKAIAWALASAAVALSVQVLDETGVMEKMTKDFAKWLKKKGAKNADLTAQLVIGIGTMLAMIAPTLLGGNLMMGVMKFFQFGVAAMLATSAMSTGMMAFSITQQGLTISAQYDAGMAGADVEEVRAMIQLIQQMIDETQEELSDILDKIQNLLGKMFDIIASALDAQKEIARKLGQMA